jgi:hypothetical protein
MVRFTALLLSLWLLLMGLPVFAQAQQAANNAGQTELALRSVSLKLVPNNPTRGAVSNISDLLREENAAKVINNLQMFRQGVWTNTGIGFAKQRAGVFNSGAQFLDFAVQLTSTGTERLLFQCGNKVYSYDTDTDTETEIGTGYSTTALPCIRSYTPTAIYLCNGDVEPRKWDGNLVNDFTVVAGWPFTVGGRSYSKPKYQELFAGRVVYSGFTAYPNTVLFSNYGNGDTFTVNSPQLATDAGAIEVPSVLGPIKGMRVLKLDNTTNDSILLVGCARGFAIITGTSALDFAGVELTREFGLLTNRSWVQLNNDLYFIGSDGIRRFSSLSTGSILSNSSVSFPVSNLVARINLSKAENAFAVHHPSTQEVQFWFPIDSGTQNDHAVIMNYNTNTIQGTGQAANSNGVLDPIFSTKDGAALACGIEFNRVMYGGGYTGYLQEHYTGNTYDGTAIEWAYVGAMAGGNNPSQNVSCKKYTIITDGGDQKFTAEAYVLVQQLDGSTAWKLADTKAINYTSPSVTAVEAWTTGSTTTYPKFLDFNPRGSGRYWTLKLKGSTASEQISFVGSMAFLTVGGLKQ